MISGAAFDQPFWSGRLVFPAVRLAGVVHAVSANTYSANCARFFGRVRD
jgi:hypothetical protein